MVNQEVSFVILTDFEQFKLFDASLSRIPNIRRKVFYTISNIPIF